MSDMCVNTCNIYDMNDFNPCSLERERAYRDLVFESSEREG